MVLQAGLIKIGCQIFILKIKSGGFDWLQFYSHYFNCVEVNSTYYTYISPKVVDGWIRKVEDANDFIFHIKLHQDFTHKRKFDEQNIKSVRYNLDLLKKSERLGGLLNPISLLIFHLMEVQFSIFKNLEISFLI